jgi:hypothetical protein
MRQKMVLMSVLHRKEKSDKKDEWLSFSPFRISSERLLTLMLYDFHLHNTYIHG